MLREVLFSIIIFMLVTTSTIFIILLIYVLRLIKISTKLKAKQYASFNENCEKNKIVFLGDSLTEFYQVDEFFHKYQVYNRGIASDTTDGVLSRLEDNVIVMEPIKIFLQIGTNDYNEGKNNDYIFNNINKILTILKERLPNTKLYLISLYPVNKRVKIYSRFFTGKRKNSNIQTLNLRLQEYYKNSDITFIDVYQHLIDENQSLKKEYSVEGLHISYLGYTVITNALSPYIEE